MSNRFLFEDFGRPVKVPESNPLPSITEEDITRATESAYQHGWDDCLAQMKQEEGRITEALGRRLADIKAERADILAELTKGTEIFLSEVLEKILPVVAQRSFGGKLTELLTNALSDGLEPQLTLYVSDDEFSAVTDLISESETFQDIKVLADANLGLTQVLLTHGKETIRFDLMAALDELDASFVEQQAFKEAANG